MSIVQYKNVMNLFENQPYHQALINTKNLTNELYMANKHNLELISRLNGIIKNLQNEVKSLKNNEKIVEVWRGNKIITYDRIKNKVTWRYWWADLPSDLIEDMMIEAIKYYYQNIVLKLSTYSLDSFEIYRYKPSHIQYNIEKKVNYSYKCQGINNNGKNCNNYGYNLRYEGVIDFDTEFKNSKLIKYTDAPVPDSSFELIREFMTEPFIPNMCRKCINKYKKKGNLFDEWIKHLGYDERNGYCIRTK